MIVVIMAWRNIWRNRVRSLVIMTSVALGLLAGIFVLSLYKGMLDDRIRTVIETEVSHLQVHHQKFSEDFDAKFVVDSPELLLKELRTNPAVRAFTLRTICQGMLATGTGSSGLQIIGSQPEQEDSVSRLSTRIIEGSYFIPEKKNQVLVGKRLAEKMHLKPGAKVILTFTDKEGSIVSGAFRIIGIYQSVNAPRDERIVYTRREDLNKLLSIGNGFHEIAILLKDDLRAVSVSSAVKQTAPTAKVETWEEISPETKLMIDTTDQYSNIFIIIIMLALSFGIVNTMLMAVLERSREIGMLIAVGMNRVKVFYMILAETILLTLTGSPVGIAISWAFVGVYHHRGIDTSSLRGDVMSEFGFSPVIYPSFPWDRMVNEMTIVLCAALLSSLIPAIKAIRLRPVEALQK